MSFLSLCDTSIFYKEKLLFAGSFDKEAARKKLEKQDLKDKEKREELRKQILARAISALEEEFQGTAVEVYLVGFLVKPNSFH